MKTKQEPAPTSSSLTDDEAIRYLQESKLLTPVLFNSSYIREIPPISYQRFVLPEIKRAFISGYDLAYQRGRDAKYKELQPLLESLGKGIIQTCESANIAVEKAKNAPRTYKEEEIKKIIEIFATFDIRTGDWWGKDTTIGTTKEITTWISEALNDSGPKGK